MNGYSPTLLDHFENPRNSGELPAANAEAQQTNPVCGDVMRLMLKIDEDRIAQARFQTNGCPAAIAASSICTEMISGLTLQQAEELRKEDITEALGGLPPSKLHAAALATSALHSAITAYRQRRGG